MFAFDYKGCFYHFQGKVNKDRLVDLRLVSLDDQSQVGQVYLGRIAKRGYQEATYFVDLGNDKHGYLQGRDLDSVVYKGSDLMVGDEVLVEVKADATLDKGPRVTTAFSIKGDYLVLLTDTQDIKFSKKIYNKATKQELLGLLLDHKTLSLGLLVRTEAQVARPEAILDDLLALESRFNDLMTLHKRRVSDRLVHLNSKPETAWLKDANTLYTNDKGAYKGHDKLVETKDWFKACDPFSLVGNLLKRRYTCMGGAELVLDQTEALVAIDVNEGSYQGQVKDPDYRLNLNLSVVDDLVLSLGLRNLSGTILVDFLNMTKDEEKTFIKTTKSLFKAGDLDIKGFTTSGLLELSKKRSHKSLKELVGSSLGDQEKNYLNAAFVAETMIQRLVSQALAYDTVELMHVEVTSALYHFLKDHQQKVVNYLDGRVRLKLYVRPWPWPEFSWYAGGKSSDKDIDIIEFV